MDTALVFDVTVVPRSSKQRCCLDKSGKIKIYLVSVPEKGKANEELIALFAHHLKISKRSISIVLGQSSKKKRLMIETALTRNEVEAALGIERQLKF